MKKTIIQFFLIIFLLLTNISIKSFNDEVKEMNELVQEKIPLLKSDNSNNYEPNNSFEEAYSINEGSFLDVKSYSGVIKDDVSIKESDYFTFNAYANSILSITLKQEINQNVNMVIYKHLNKVNPNFSDDGIIPVIEKFNSYMIFNEQVNIAPGTYYICVSTNYSLKNPYTLNYHIELEEKHEIDLKEYQNNSENGFYLWKSDFQVLDTNYLGVSDYYLAKANDKGEYPHILMNEYFELGGFMTSEIYIWSSSIKQILGQYLTNYIDKLSNIEDKIEEKDEESTRLFFNVIKVIFSNIKMFIRCGMVDIISILKLIENDSSLDEFDQSEINKIKIYYRFLSNSLLLDSDSTIGTNRISKIEKKHNKFYLNEFINCSDVGESKSKYLNYCNYESDKIYDCKDYFFNISGYHKIYGKCIEMSPNINVFDYIKHGDKYDF